MRPRHCSHLTGASKRAAAIASLTAIAVLLAAGCRSEPADGATCDAASGVWELRALRCEPVGDLRAALGLEAATWDLRGPASRSEWRLPGCEIGVTLSAEVVAGSTIRLHETHHACAASPGAAVAVPCCETGVADLTLAFHCTRDGAEMLWTATLAEPGDETGPWRGRGPWRGCAGEVRATLARAGPADDS